MKLKLLACLVMVGALVTVTQVVAAPLFDPFLSVDLDAYRSSDQPNPGPTQAGFQSWVLVDSALGNWSPLTATPVTQAFPTAEGNVTVTITPVGPSSRGARDRGDTGPEFGDLYRDIIFEARGDDGFGRHYLKVVFAGLVPGQVYEVTPFTRDTFNGGVGETDSSFQAWSDLAELGGFDGPDVWLDTFEGPGALYQPVYAPTPDPLTDGIYKNPIPTLGRAPTSGPNPTDPYHYTVSFFSTADAGGNVTVYGWADPQSYSGTQTVSLLNGFQLGIVPEPTSLAMFAVGLLGMLVAGRRRVS